MDESRERGRRDKLVGIAWVDSSSSDNADNFSSFCGNVEWSSEMNLILGLAGMTASLYIFFRYLQAPNTNIFLALTGLFLFLFSANYAWEDIKSREIKKKGRR